MLSILSLIALSSSLASSTSNDLHGFPSDAPLRSFNISTTNFVPGSTPFVSAPVLRSGTLVGKWALCSPKSPHSACFRLERYEDRLSFHYEVNSDFEGAFDHLEPDISSSSKRARPRVVDFNVDSSGGRFTVLLGCVIGNSDEPVLISVLLETVSDSPITLRFAATCAFGEHPYVDAVALRRALPSLQLRPITPPLVVPHYQSISTVLVHIRPPAQALIHGVPILTSLNPSAVRVELKGLIANGTFLSAISTRLSVIYECLGTRVSFVILRIPIPPWKDIRVMFVKRCSVPLPVSMFISLVSRNISVVSHGAADIAFHVNGAVVKHADTVAASSFWSIPANETHTDFDMRSDEALRISNALITLSDPSVAHVSVLAKGFLNPVPFRDVVIKKDRSVRFVLYSRCLKRGYTIVLVTFIVFNYQIVEMGFTKYCEGEQLSDSIPVDNAVEILVLITAAVCVFVLCSMLRRKRISRIAKFTRLPTEPEPY